MASYSIIRINDFFLSSDMATLPVEKGRVLENLTCYLFEEIPGITVSMRNQMNEENTEEIDIAFWNDQFSDGLNFLPHIILVECKNHSKPIDSRDVSFFIQKVQNRGLDFGILVASNGITGSSQDLQRAHYEIAMALSRKIRIIVITRIEIENLSNTDILTTLIKRKLCELAVCGSIILNASN